MRDLIKKCSKCELPYAATEEYFYPDPRTTDGLRSECKTCTCDSVSIDYYENQFDILEKRREAYYADHEAKKAYFREYRRKQRMTAAATA
jgi:hypothetical protein